MNSEYGQNTSKENSVEQRKTMEELKRMNQPSSAPQQMCIRDRYSSKIAAALRTAE